MRLRLVLRPRLAIALLGLCALASSRIVWSTVREFRELPESNADGAAIARFEPLRRLLPEGAVTGFVGDSPERFLMAQYALSPRVVERSSDHALVVVDADAPALPEVAGRRRMDSRGRSPQRGQAVSHARNEMTMVWLVASLLSPWFFSYVLVSRCDHGARRANASRWLHACLAVGIGLGLSSCTYLIWLLCFGPPGRVFWIVETLGFAVGGLLWGWRAAGGGPPRSPCRRCRRHPPVAGRQFLSRHSLRHWPSMPSAWPGGMLSVRTASLTHGPSGTRGRGFSSFQGTPGGKPSSRFISIAITRC